MGMSNAVLTSYSQHIFFHGETYSRISLIFFPDLFSVGSCSENSSQGADLFGSATVKKRHSARDVLSFRFSDCSFSKGCPDTDPPLLLSSIQRHFCARRYRQPKPGLGPSSNEAIRKLSICIPKNVLSTISFSGPTTNVPWSRTGGQMPKQM